MDIHPQRVPPQEVYCRTCSAPADGPCRLDATRSDVGIFRFIPGIFHQVRISDAKYISSQQGGV